MSGRLRGRLAVLGAVLLTGCIDGPSGCRGYLRARQHVTTQGDTTIRREWTDTAWVCRSAERESRGHQGLHRASDAEGDRNG